MLVVYRAQSYEKTSEEQNKCDCFFLLKPIRNECSKCRQKSALGGGKIFAGKISLSGTNWKQNLHISCYLCNVGEREKVPKKLFFAHRRGFCAHFLPKFCAKCARCKHAKFSKVNAKFFCGVDFWKPVAAFFFKIFVNILIINTLLKSLKIHSFSRKNFFVQNFRVLEGVNGRKRPKIRGNFEHCRPCVFPNMVLAFLLLSKFIPEPTWKSQLPKETHAHQHFL